MKADKSLYQNLLGNDWERLSKTVKRGFAGNGSRYGKGRFSFRRGQGVLSRFIGWLESLPDETRGVDTEILITPYPGGEIWRRKFGAHIFVTEQRAIESFLLERFGVIEFFFKLRVDEGALVFDYDKTVLKLHFFDVTLPFFLSPRIKARSWEEDLEGKIRLGMKVDVNSTLTGLLWAYEGYMDME